MRGVQFNLNISILICYVLLIVVIILDIRYGNVTECDKLMDKPIGFVHMDNQKVICTANTFCRPPFSQSRIPNFVCTVKTIPNRPKSYSPC